MIPAIATSFFAGSFLIGISALMPPIAGAARELFLRVVEHEEREIEEPAAHAPAVDEHVLLVEVPAARPDLQRRDLVVEAIGLGAGGGLLLERQRAANRLREVDLALDLV